MWSSFNNYAYITFRYKNTYTVLSKLNEEEFFFDLWRLQLTIGRFVIKPVSNRICTRKVYRDNGAALLMILDQAKRLDLPGVGLLLDQEKAYNRLWNLFRFFSCKMNNYTVLSFDDLRILKGS
ncbi:hypothetical protein BDF21DRAFT_450863 [Thamnidium elegans]|nr:hypothetical protein BDF21DRAFT_450863 [Thamnidium elegans]